MFERDSDQLTTIKNLRAENTELQRQIVEYQRIIHGYSSQTPAASDVPQAPIAKITVDDDCRITSAEFYTPALPEGTYDLYLKGEPQTGPTLEGFADHNGTCGEPIPGFPSEPQTAVAPECDHLFAGPAGFEDAVCMKGCGKTWKEVEGS